MTDTTSTSIVPGTVPTKVLHVDSPETTYWHIRQCAIESRMSMKGFVAELGRKALPIKLDTTDSDQDFTNESDSSGRTAA